MWKIRHSVEARATEEIVWQRWIDVRNWPAWSDDVEWSELTGPFVVGAQGRLKPKEGPVMRFTLTEVKPRRGFTDESSLPLFGKIKFVHAVTPTETGVRITHEVLIGGPLRFVFSRVIGRQIQKDLPRVMQNLVRSCEGAFDGQRSR